MEVESIEIAAPAIPPRDLARLFEQSVLSPEVKLEPLMGRWPLWPHLIPPAQFALNLSLRLLPALRSFVQNPQLHADAARDPALFGGPFVALTENDQLAVLDLLEFAQRQWGTLLEFADNLRAFDRRLQTTATGFCLDDYYSQLPRSLAGLVEVVYDLNHHPRLRLIEALMYDSPLDDRSAQGVCLHAIDDSLRPFFMNTPLLDAPNRVFLPVPLSDPIIDQLAAARMARGITSAIQSWLVQECASESALQRFLSQEEPVRVRPEHQGEPIRLRYFGHACVLVQCRGTAVLIDPSTAWQRDDDLATLTFNDLPDHIDYVVISHGHQDHLVAETLIQLRRRIGHVVIPPSDPGNLADPSLRLMLQRLGFERIVTLETFAPMPIPGGELLSVPFTGEHGDLDIAAKQGVLVRFAGRQLLFMVDSNAVDVALTERIAERIGPVDVVFLGMECCGAPVSWVYGPLFTQPLSRKNDQSRRFSGSDCERAWEAVRTLGCRRVFVYAMGQEPWVRHLMGLEYSPDAVQLREARRFVERCNLAGISAAVLKGCYEEMLS